MNPAIEELASLNQWVAWSRNKVPIAPDGRAASTTDPTSWGSLDAAKFVRAQKGLPGVGFVFTADDEFVGVDLDDSVVDGQMEPWAKAIVEQLSSYTELSPSGEGVHIICRGEIPYAIKRKCEGGKVEVYDRKRYFTMTGKHVEGTADTIRHAEKALAKLIEWGSKGRNEGVVELETTYEAALPMQWLPEALDYIDSDPHDIWLHVGMALRNEIGDQAFGLWNTWSARSDKYPGARALEQRWKSFSTNGSGKWTLGTVVFMAGQHGYTLPDEFKGRIRTEIPDGFVHDDWDEWIASHVIGETSIGLDIEFFDFAEAYLDDTPPEEDLVGPGVLGTGDIMVVAGPPKSMKSFLILDMLKCWCLDEEWHGTRPTRALRAAFIQFELKADKMRERIQLGKLTMDEVDALRGRLAYTGRFSPQLTMDTAATLAGNLKNNMSAVLDGSPDILVFDPMANIFSGDNENDNTQMSGFVNLLKGVRNHINPDAAIILVHHASKRSMSEREADPFNAIRGGSSLRGHYDTGVYVERQQEGHVRMWMELRNGPALPGLNLGFKDGTFFDIEAELVERIEDKILEDADKGVAWMTSSFKEHFAECWGISEPLIGGVVGKMLKGERLIRWKPDGHQDNEGEELTISPRSKGFLGIDGMLFNGMNVRG